MNIIKVHSYLSCEICSDVFNITPGKNDGITTFKGYSPSSFISYQINHRYNTFFVS